MTRELINVSDVVGRGAIYGARGRDTSSSAAHVFECGRAAKPRESRPHRRGASVLFLGIVRDHSQEKKVLYLEYEAYEEMAEQTIKELVNSTFRRWRVEDIEILHRLGRVDLGEIAIAIDVRSVHRDEAYQASRYLIEEIKHQVPIWKKEYFADGTSEWGGCQIGNYAELPRSV